MFKFEQIKRGIFLILFIACAGFSGAASAADGCPVDGINYACVPFQYTPWQYLPSDSDYHYAVWRLFPTAEAAYADFVAKYTVTCPHTVGPLSEFVSNPLDNGTHKVATMVITLSSACPGNPGAQLTAWVSALREATCAAGYTQYNNSLAYCIARVNNPVNALQVTATTPTIPANSTTQNGKVLTKSNLTLRVTQGSQPVSGMLVGLQSSRGPTADIIHGPSAPTDASGTSVADVSTHAQPGQSTITALSPPNLQTKTPANINWLPARYESQFLVTCYILAQESAAAQTPVSSNVCGLPSANRYRTEFLDAVKRQGSGKALDGTIIHINGRHNGHDCYNTDSCARTSTGVCASVGTTIAVDPSVIPRRSSVSVDILGPRKAQDGGSWINGYHIDDYMGPIPKAVCDDLGRRNSGIVFQSY